MTKRFHMSRRTFLKVAAGGAVVVLGGGYLFRDQFLNDGNPSSTATDVIRGQRLPIPDLLTGTEIDGKQVYDLTMQQGSMVYVPGKQTATFAYNGNILGPTLLMHKGDEVVINVTNQLGEPTTTHWHGIHLPAIMDGGPHQIIDDGSTWQAQYTIMNEEATFWYHPHLEGMTAEHVYAGLAGLLIVKDPQSELALPDQYGSDDIPLIVQDKIIDADGSFNYPGTNFGVKGDQFLVNGAVTPVFDAPAQLVRFRLLNGSNARFYNFGFSDDRQFHQIGTDGGLLERPVPMTRLRLSNGERAEILVDFSGQQGSQVRLMSFSSELDGINPVYNSNALDNSTFDLMTIDVVSATANPTTDLPASLATISRIEEDQVSRTRSFELEMGFSGPMTINGVSMDMDRIDQTVKVDDTEIWEVVNSSDMPHPFHVHDIQFLVLTRDGSPPADNEAGWKDTVLVMPRETVRIITRFSDYTDPDHPYMFHCHILEHEDAGMMGQFVVVA
ncbi:MAG: multicopper oxidase domain-containing protein [Acidobacteria bacterium]|nr:multicopper oxidase domain-containing protein [Acidobacteriota bacterium]